MATRRMICGATRPASHSSMVQLRYPAAARAVIDCIERTQADNIERAADIFAASIAADGLVHMFGAGHSRMGVEEIFPRIGSIVGYHPIVELALTYYTNVVGTMGLKQSFFLERVDGYGEVILDNYEFGPHDSMLVISSTGINNVVVAVALGAKRRGLPVVAITSFAHSQAARSRHASGKRLMEVADVAIDNCTPPGDAMIEIDGAEYPVGPGSTIGTATVAHSINERVATKLVERGAPPIVLGSPHFQGAEGAEERAKENLDRYFAEYRRRVRRV